MGGEETDELPSFDVCTAVNSVNAVDDDDRPSQLASHVFRCSNGGGGRRYILLAFGCNVGVRIEC